MSRTYGEILDNVCLISNESLITAFADTSSPYPEIKKFIQNAVEEMCSCYPWTFRETSYTFNTVIGTSEYTLPAYVEACFILKDGVRIEDEDEPLDFIEHQELDKDLSTENSKPDRYSIFSGKFTLDAPPDDIYQITIKYLKSYFAYDSLGTAKVNIENETDYTIIPDRNLKVIEYRAAALYRQQFFDVDNKYAVLNKEYEKYLKQALGADGHGKDAVTTFVIGSDRLSRFARQMNNFYHSGLR